VDHVEDIDGDAPLEGGYYDSDEVPALRPRRTGPVLALDDYVIADIVEYLERGAFFHVAAEAAGVEVDLAKHWLALGRAVNADEPYRAFADRVLRAKAIARAEAESRVWLAKPATWLRQGPGRDRGRVDRPGWTNAVKVTGEMRHSGTIGHIVAVLDPEKLKKYSDADLLQLEQLTARALPAKQDPNLIDVSPTVGK
jgi:hypothetical protein